MSTEKKWSDVWVETSFDTNLNKNNNETKQKSKKRSLNDLKNSESKQSNSKSNNKDLNINVFNNPNNCLIDSFVPKSSDELAFSKQKLNELNDWFRKQLIDCENGNKYLLLKGPTGAGKTTSLKVLAKEFNVEVVEYKAHNQYFERNCFDDTLIETNSNTILSMNQFESFKKFVWNANYYNKCLGFESNDGVMSSSNSTQSVDRLKKLILIEEFPNIFYIKPESLHKELRRLEKRFGNRCVPIVFIISETINGQSDEYKLLPKTIQTELRIKTINFKPITDLSLHKLLSKLCNYKLSKDEIQKIIDCSSGDIRSAINNMQLKYMHSFNDKTEHKSNSGKDFERAKKMKSFVESNFESGGRDASLTLSHAIGKVLYAKRADLETNASNRWEENSFKMPEHLSHNERKPLIENAENIAEKLVVSSDVFNAWLHQNYLDFVDNIDNALECIEWLSETDSMFSGQDSVNKTITDSYQSSLAMRGLMFNLRTANSESSDSELIDSKVGSNTKSNSRKSNFKFKPFVKPKAFAINRSVNSLKHQICQSLPQLTPFSSIDSLVIDVMPFISQMPNHLRETDSQFRNVLNKVVNYDENQIITETELCSAFSQSTFDQNFDEMQNSNSFKPIMNEHKSDKNNGNSTQINTGCIDSDNEEDYKIESDSD